MTDSLLLQIERTQFITSYVEENYMTIFSSFSANFPPHSHTILEINCVHASNWFTHLQQHDKLMVKMTILFLLCTQHHSKHAMIIVIPKLLICMMVELSLSQLIVQQQE